MLCLPAHPGTAPKLLAQVGALAGAGGRGWDWMRGSDCFPLQERLVQVSPSLPWAGAFQPQQPLFFIFCKLPHKRRSARAMRVCLCCGAEPMGQYTSRAPDAGAGISAGGSFAHEHCFFFSFQPDNHPGNCWPFPGSQGHVFIMLPRAIFPTAVTLTHGIPANAYRADSISSAPKDFAVYVTDSSGLWWW